MQPRTAIGGLTVSGLLAVLVLGACSNDGSSASSSTSSTSTSTTATSSSTAIACTKSLITAAAMNSSTVGAVTALNDFGCAGSWAYADVTVGSGSASFDAVIVLQAHGSSWSVADRGSACNDHLVPSAIYTRACTTS
jgi:hypothetical protein